MKTETIKRERQGAIERQTIRVTYTPQDIGRAIHNHTRIGRYPKMLAWDWMHEDERGIGWFGEHWGHPGRGGQLRRRASMATALKSIAEMVGDRMISAEPERNAYGMMTGNIIVVETRTLDWGALAGAFSI